MMGLAHAAAANPIIVPLPGGGGGGPILVAVDRLELHCASSRHRYAQCVLPSVAIKARVLRRVSQARCDEGRSFGTRGNVLWVHHGCRADFEVFVHALDDIDVDELD
jgi:hypothetical protein